MGQKLSVHDVDDIDVRDSVTTEHSTYKTVIVRTESGERVEITLHCNHDNTDALEALA